MGRKRKHRRDLPERIYQKHGAYYFVDACNKWQRIGKTFSEAMIFYSTHVKAAIQPLSTLSEIVERYQLDRMPTFSKNTQKNRLHYLIWIKESFGHGKPQDITPQMIYAAMDAIEKNHGPHAAIKFKGVLSDIYNHAIRWGCCTINQVTHVKNPKTKLRSRYISDKEFSLVYEQAGPQLQCVIDIAYLTALRIGDILKIKLSDIVGNELHVTTQKTDKKIIFTIEHDLAAVIERAKQLPGAVHSMFLFNNKYGKQLAYSRFNDKWRAALETAGLRDADIHFHDLRAKALTDYDEQGGNSQKMAGHKNRVQTEHYIKQRKIDVVIPLKKPNS